VSKIHTAAFLSNAAWVQLRAPFSSDPPSEQVTISDTMFGPLCGSRRGGFAPSPVGSGAAAGPAPEAAAPPAPTATTHGSRRGGSPVGSGAAAGLAPEAAAGPAPTAATHSMPPPSPEAPLAPAAAGLATGDSTLSFAGTAQTTEIAEELGSAVADGVAGDWSIKASGCSGRLESSKIARQGLNSMDCFSSTSMPKAHICLLAKAYTDAETTSQKGRLCVIGALSEVSKELFRDISMLNQCLTHSTFPLSLSKNSIVVLSLCVLAGRVSHGQQRSQDFVECHTLRTRTPVIRRIDELCVKIRQHLLCAQFLFLPYLSVCRVSPDAEAAETPLALALGRVFILLKLQLSHVSPVKLIDDASTDARSASS